MENISENKRKRGRPKKILDNGCTYNQWIAAMGNLLNTEHHAMRSHQNDYYQIHAFGALRDENQEHPLNGEFSFIVAGDSTKATTFKQTILQELGRLEDPEYIREAARIICERKMKTTEAVKFLRRCRCEPKKGSALDLAAKIEQVINEYRSYHPDISDRVVLNILDNIMLCISENISENQDNGVQ